MSKAPERAFIDPGIIFPECDHQYDCDVEYIRADIHAARIKELESKFEKAREVLRKIAKPRVDPDVDWTENEVNSWRAGRYREYGKIAHATLKKLKENET